MYEMDGELLSGFMSKLIVDIKLMVVLLAWGIIHVLSLQLAVFQTTAESTVLLKTKTTL